MQQNIALQVWTVQAALDSDLVGTYRKIAEIGYRAVEIGGTGALSDSEFKQFMDELGIRVIGFHCAIERLENEFDRVIEQMRALNCPRIIVPWLGEDRYGTIEAARDTAKLLGRLNAKVKDRGLTLGYHNHSFEFAQKDGVDIYDILMDPTLSGDIEAELDVYWLAHGGKDPVEYIERMSDRLKLIHMKDMAPGEERAFAEVGEGIIDMTAVIAAAKEAGVKWFIVEQDVCRTDPFECIATSLRNLSAMLG